MPDEFKVLLAPYFNIMREIKAFMSGATPSSILHMSNLSNIIPQGIFDFSLMSETTHLIGVGIPSFLVYLVLFSD